MKNMFRVKKENRAVVTGQPLWCASETVKKPVAKVIQELPDTDILKQAYEKLRQIRATVKEQGFKGDYSLIEVRKQVKEYHDNEDVRKKMFMLLDRSVMQHMEDNYTIFRFVIFDINEAGQVVYKLVEKKFLGIEEVTKHEHLICIMPEQFEMIPSENNFIKGADEKARNYFMQYAIEYKEDDKTMGIDAYIESKKAEIKEREAQNKALWSIVMNNYKGF